MASQPATYRGIAISFYPDKKKDRQLNACVIKTDGNGEYTKDEAASWSVARTSELRVGLARVLHTSGQQVLSQLTDNAHTGKNYQVPIKIAWPRNDRVEGMEFLDPVAVAQSDLADRRILVAEVIQNIVVAGCRRFRADFPVNAVQMGDFTFNRDAPQSAEDLAILRGLVTAARHGNWAMGVLIDQGVWNIQRIVARHEALAPGSAETRFFRLAGAQAACLGQVPEVVEAMKTEARRLQRLDSNTPIRIAFDGDVQHDHLFDVVVSYMDQELRRVGVIS
ncbi:MAG: hypothetical protein Q8P95_02785 [bacterium]|nr:hypothetical protein [bacterium]